MSKRSAARHAANKERAEVSKIWKTAKLYGAINPDYIPECPDCDTDDHMGDSALYNTGVFLCGKCRAYSVVVLMDGEEIGVLVEELNELEACAIVEPTESEAKSHTYSPYELVEEANAFIAR